jgi:uncharacterized coiled-coil DUF342 family protein
MVKSSLDNLIGEKEELRNLRQLLKTTKKQIDEATETGNQSLLEMQLEYDELAAKKRDLLREIEQLERKRDELKGKTEAAETLYGKYLTEIKSGMSGSVV